MEEWLNERELGHLWPVFKVPAKVIWAVAGKDAELPCDVTPPVPGDNVTMIFWFKDTIGMPLYSLDARGGPLALASHLAMSDDLGRRSYFIADEEPSNTRLRIQNVISSDQGIFRCRVDFVNSPTRNFQVNLTLVDQPTIPKIFDAEGREIRVNTSAGPFLEGHELFLSCQVTGGRPRPTLFWYHNNTVLDGVVDSSRGSQMTVNQLLITSLPRHFKGARLECRASSSSIAGDVVREVPITVFLKPKKVKIVTPNDLLSTSKAQNIRCETSGSYPPAKLNWMVDGRPIRDAVVTEEETSSFTSSILSLNVNADDDGKELICRANNPRFPAGHKEDRRHLHIAYPPKVSVIMDPSNPSPVQQGTDVILRCNTLARPTASSYHWYHDNHLVPFNETAGTLPSNDILTLKNIGPNSAGLYACSAKNSEGETYSSPLELTIQYSPYCKKGYEDLRVGVVPQKTIVAQCLVNSVPSVNRFWWTYNTSKEVMPIKGAKIQSKGNVSVLQLENWSPDLESVSCWAENDVGKQDSPCIFHMVLAEPPEPPKSCSVHNSTRQGLEVACIAGKDGGLHQSFILEVIDVTGPASHGVITTLSDQGEAPSPAFRVLGDRPLFRLPPLKANKDYQALIFAENARGRSNPPVVLSSISFSGKFFEENTQKDADTSIYIPNINLGSSSPSKNLTVIIAGLSATAVLLVTSIVVAATFIACRNRRARQRSSEPPRRSSKPPSELELSEAGFGEGFHRRSALYRASMYGDCEERISRLIEAGVHAFRGPYGPSATTLPPGPSPSTADYTQNYNYYMYLQGSNQTMHMINSGMSPHNLAGPRL